MIRSTADAPVDTTLRDLVDALITEQLRHDRRQVLVRNEYHATCSCGEWRAAEPGNYLTRWCAHRDDALLPLLRAHDAQVAAQARRDALNKAADDLERLSKPDDEATPAHFAALLRDRAVQDTPDQANT
jgi:hypothetical protein